MTQETVWRCWDISLCPNALCGGSSILHPGRGEILRPRRSRKTLKAPSGAECLKTAQRISLLKELRLIRGNGAIDISLLNGAKPNRIIEPFFVYIDPQILQNPFRFS